MGVLYVLDNRTNYMRDTTLSDFSVMYRSALRGLVLSPTQNN
jgi:hypothetical protein